MEWVKCPSCGWGVAPTTAPKGAQGAAMRTHEGDHRKISAREPEEADAAENRKRIASLLNEAFGDRSRKVKSITLPRQETPRRFDHSM